MQNSYDEKTVEYAGFWVRFSAFLVDSLLVGTLTLAARLVLAAGFSVFGLFEGNPLDVEVLFTYTWRDIILYFLGAAYYIICTFCAGTTAGKWLFNLRVVSSGAVNGEKLRLFDVVYRETIGKFLSGVILNIGYIIAGIDGEKRALHDILCDTRVIYAKRIKVIPVRPGKQPYMALREPTPHNPGGLQGTPCSRSADGPGNMPGSSRNMAGCSNMPGTQMQAEPESTSEKNGKNGTSVQDTIQQEYKR